MHITLLVHVAAGVLGIVFGFVALYAAKGARLHRRSGMLFVYATLTMALLGAGMAAVRNVQPASNVPVGLTLFTFGLETVGRFKFLPAQIRSAALLALPLVVLATMSYWLWRLRVRRAARTLSDPSAILEHT